MALSVDSSGFNYKTTTKLLIGETVREMQQIIKSVMKGIQDFAIPVRLPGNQQGLQLLAVMHTKRKINGKGFIQ